MPKSAEREIEKNIVPLVGEQETGRVALGDQLCEPSVVQVASQIASFEMTVPKAGNQDKRRNSYDPQPVFS